MRVAKLDDVPQAAANGPILTKIEAEDRGRLSGPGLRAFRAIAEHWGLGETERRVLLGEPPRSTYHQWMRKAQARETVSLPLDTLLRISAVLGIHKALTILFEHPHEALTWLKGAHQSVVFAHQSPLEVMLSGSPDGLMIVRRYLDAWRGGLPGGPASEGDIAPVRSEDIVFL